MTPSQELELKIYRFADSIGKARWRATSLPDLSSALQFYEHLVLIDAIHDLYARQYLDLQQWDYERGGWVSFEDVGSEFFDRNFSLRVSFSGRKYFESLDAQGSDQNLAAAVPEIRFRTLARETNTERARLDSSPQQVVTPVPTNPSAFVSHSGKDRQFVERFVADLWAVGVRAWYSKWEIKPGDSIPTKIDEGIEECEFFVIVFSRNSIRAPWVQTELQAAVARQVNGKLRKIIPITIDDCNDLPPIIDSLCREDFANQPYEAALKRVLDSIFDVDVRPQLGTRIG